jgi:hypothetical protein
MPSIFSSIHSWFSSTSRLTRWFVVAAVLSMIGSCVPVYSAYKPTLSSDEVVAEIQTSVMQTLTAQPVALPSDTPLYQFIPSMTNVPANPTSPQNTETANFPYVTIGNTCNASAYVSDVTIPDGTFLALGANFVKTWKFKNTGFCTWNKNYWLIFTSGNLMNGKATKINQSVAPGQQAQISVSLTAPATNGTYIGYWRLADESGRGFGGIVYLQIVASNTIPSATPTKTKTGTPTKTTTSCGGGTATASSTSITFTPTTTLVNTATNTATPTIEETNTPIPPSPTTTSDTPTDTTTPIPTITPTPT